ncbi:MAG TPA: C39 family peptidase [Caulobacteraceae bacterium]|nr:C39 family peptidase [Caulobacteraceae bacterium]
MRCAVLIGACLVLASWAGAMAAGAPRSTAITPPETGGYYRVGVVSYRDLPFETVVRQQYDFSCGSASLATLLRYNYGRDLDEATIFKAMYLVGDQAAIKRAGFSLADIKAYLASIGYSSDGYRVKLSQLEGTHIPAIALMQVGHYKHFVVIEGVENGRVLVGDPAIGLRDYSDRDFEHDWDGLVFIIHDTAHPNNHHHFNDPAEWAMVHHAPLEPATHTLELGNEAAVLDASTIFAVRQPSLANIPPPF